MMWKATLILSFAVGHCFCVPLADSSLSPRAPATFKHPGVFVSRAQLDFVKAKVAESAQPWADAYTALLQDGLTSLTRKPKPRAVVECGSKSNPNNGCTDERQDALAAYALSLAWYISGDAKYAQKSISYMNAWAAALQSHTNSNAPLQTAWAGTSWARAGELIKHTYTGWSSSDVSAFENMLRTKYLPTVRQGSPLTGNWDLVLLETTIEIAVFLEDRTAYDDATNLYLGAVPAYVYLSGDGSYPKPRRTVHNDKQSVVNDWWQQSTFVEGLTQESCRDLTHTGYGIASIGHFAETAWIQGNDYYSGTVGERLRKALGFHTQYENGTPVPSWLCQGFFNHDDQPNDGLGPVSEVGLNAMATRLGYGMDNTAKYTQARRPMGTNSLFVGWETLTHARNPANA